MRVIRKIGFFSLLVVATLFIQDAAATLILPHSTYGDLNGWQGSRIYEDNGFNVLVDFTVYDTETYQNEFIGTDGFVNPGEGRYIYTYQIFNHPAADEDIAYFGIFGIDGATIDEATIDGLSSQDDGAGGVPTYDEYFDDDLARVVWEFDWGILIPGKHSYFLVFSSDYEPTVGDFEIRGFEEEGEFPVPVPEPATPILLGLGSALIFMRQRKSFQ